MLASTAQPLSARGVASLVMLGSELAPASHPAIGQDRDRNQKRSPHPHRSDSAAAARQVIPEPDLPLCGLDRELVPVGNVVDTKGGEAPRFERAFGADRDAYPGRRGSFSSTKCSAAGADGSTSAATASVRGNAYFGMTSLGTSGITSGGNLIGSQAGVRLLYCRPAAEAPFAPGRSVLVPDVHGGVAGDRARSRRRRRRPPGTAARTATGP